MAIFTGTSAFDIFSGTSGRDTLRYFNSPTGVTLDILNGTGLGGDAEGDIFSDIERFDLSDFDDVVDGSGVSYELFLFGGAGDDVLIGGDGGNRLDGGTGSDQLTGGSGGDTFVIAAGDAGITGDSYDGGGGNDEIVLVSGGVGTTFDLSLATISNIEKISFRTDATAIFADDSLVSLVRGSVARTDEIVFIQNWVDDSDAAIFSSVSTYLGNNIDAVEWVDDQGDVRAELNAVSGNVQITYTNNGVVAEPYATRTVELDSAGAVVSLIEVSDDGVDYFAEFDPSGGPGNEVILNELFEDFGVFEIYETIFFDYALDGVADGILDYSLILFDDGVLIESGYENGILAVEFTQDLSLDGLALNFEYQLLMFNPDGSPLYSDTLFDPGASFDQITVEYDANGDEIFRLQWTQGFAVSKTVITDPGLGVSETTWEGDITDNTITGGDEDETFLLGGGADLNIGNGGDDIFVLSDVDTDGVWTAPSGATGIFSRAEGIGVSNGGDITANLTGRTMVDDTILGGEGTDRIEGTSEDEVILLFDTTFNDTMGAVDLLDANVIGVEEFDMGGGNDVVNLTSVDSRLAYTTDVMIDGGSGNDDLFAGAGNDIVIGGLGLDRIVGGAGDNVLTGGEVGGGGDGVQDIFYFSALTGGGTTRITDFEAGTDTIYALGYGVSGLMNAQLSGAVTVSTVGSDKVIELTDGVHNTTIILEGYTGPITGTDLQVFDTTPSLPPVFLNNVPIAGDSADNALVGDGNNDTFMQTEGADLLEGLGGDDTFTLTSNIDGTWGVDTPIGLRTYAEGVETTGGLKLEAVLDGKVQIADVFVGGTGEDSVIGTAADEALLLYEANFTDINPALSVTDARIIGVEYFDLGGGNDILNLTSEDGQMGYATDVTVDGGDGDDFIFSGAGNDTLNGGTGIDRLVGGKGDDVLTGGLGEEDRFIFGAGSGGGTDIITDFEVGVDTFFGVGFGVGGGYFNALNGGIMTVTTSGGDTIITLDDGTITTDVILQGVTSADVGDFTFYA